MLLISFGSIGAVSLTPALPQITEYFSISPQQAGSCISLYLIGYTLGQLFYGPLVNRFGSRTTIIIGASIEIIGAVLCILAEPLNSFNLLLIARIIMAIGAGSGLTLALTISSKLSTAQDSGRNISLLTIAFAITPGIGVFAGGWLLTIANWTSSFYLMAAYGVMILLLGLQLPEVISSRNPHALQIAKLISNYLAQLKFLPTICGGLLLGSATSIIYGFAALAPFISINLMQITPSQYGSYNLIPVIGMLLGSIISSYLGKSYSSHNILKLGLTIVSIGAILALVLLNCLPEQALSLFMPTTIVYIGLPLVFANASSLTLTNAQDKSNASAMLSFINLSSAVVVTLLLTLISIHSVLTIAILFVVFSIFAIIWFTLLNKALKLN